MNKLNKVQSVELSGKTVLMRVDHNVVKNGEIIDPYRIDATLPTINHIIDEGAKLVLMTHIGRPRDKATGKIDISDKTSVKVIVEYLQKKGIKVLEADLPEYDEFGISHLDPAAINTRLNQENVEAVYLPNTRWFKGEEAKDDTRNILGKEMADLADIFVNDAFGSWQPHASTIVPAQFIPAYAGILMQKEIIHLDAVLKPHRPFVAVVAGSKFDTKMEPLSALLNLADFLILGGVIYNAYLCAKYDVKIAGISEDDRKIALEFVKLASKFPNKVIEPQFIVESDTLEGKFNGQYRILDIRKLSKGQELNYVLDIDSSSFESETMQQLFADAGTFFVNAVMGLTPHFTKGTIALDSLISDNYRSIKLFGGGDTLQEFANLLPELYREALEDRKYYFFTGGGTILKAISEDSVWGLEPVKALKK